MHVCVCLSVMTLLSKYYPQINPKGPCHIHIYIYVYIYIYMYTYIYMVNPP